MEFDFVDEVLDVAAVGCSDVDEPVVREALLCRATAQSRSVTEFEAHLHRLTVQHRRRQLTHSANRNISLHQKHTSDSEKKNKHLDQLYTYNVDKVLSHIILRTSLACNEQLAVIRTRQYLASIRQIRLNSHDHPHTQTHLHRTDYSNRTIKVV